MMTTLPRKPRVQIEYDVEIGDCVRKVQLPWVTGVMADLSGDNAGIWCDIRDRSFFELNAGNFSSYFKEQKPRVTFTVANLIAGDGIIDVDIVLEEIDDFSPGKIVWKLGHESPSKAEPLTGLLDRRRRLQQQLSSFDGATSVGEDVCENHRGYARTSDERSQALQDNPKAPDAIEAAIADIDRRLSRQINLIIHHEKFRRLEGSWRGLAYLVENTATSDSLRIKVLNISKKEIHKQLKVRDSEEYFQTELFKKIYEEEYGTPGGQPFGVVIGDYDFGPSGQDVQVLRGMSRIAAASHTPFIGAAAADLFDMDSWAELMNAPDLRRSTAGITHVAWNSLRSDEEARYLGLTMPRVLARMPYGSATNPLEAFEFEEAADVGSGAELCFSNAIYAFGANINRSFQENGWPTQIRGLESGGIVDNLPGHAFPTDDGVIDLRCPTEIAITDRREKELADLGLMPLSHYKNCDYACFFGAQALKRPDVYMEADTQINENCACRLPYTFGVCRFAQYLKCMVRDKIGSFMKTSDLQAWLNQWLANYVSDSDEEEVKASKPLAEARVDVADVVGSPGSYRAILYIHPHFQLEGLTGPLRVLITLKQKG
ncbi:type VI secretion system contractile sheath large subunit [Haloferula sp. A504]|uniref:type VI secretion system contractile sheath large subunit n=1 Tax=Haloferula sp. A504 TaxID=3373601 RepID=UPI0031CBCC65|nr:type VI secretion system contractile sheath large subunit [Verrucomicrobiaceae bacterium E54]